eukprot:SAG11_NODE_6903_length_1228_cov_2.542958_1_plen_372_part_01
MLANVRAPDAPPRVSTVTRSPHVTDVLVSFCSARTGTAMPGAACNFKIQSAMTMHRTLTISTLLVLHVLLLHDLPVAGASTNSPPKVGADGLSIVAPPVAVRKGNTVALGEVRITVHSANMLRAEWSADKRFEDRPSVTWLNRSVSAPFEHAVEATGVLVVRTADAVLRYDPTVPPPAPRPPPPPPPPPCEETRLVAGSCFESGASPMRAKPTTGSSAEACRTSCCVSAGCAGFSFLTRQGDRTGGNECPFGKPCCWLKTMPHGGRGVFAPHANCTSGLITARNLPLPTQGANPAPRFGPGSLTVAITNNGSRTVWSPANGSDQSCRVWGHDRRPCGDKNVSHQRCLARGCCLRELSPLEQSGGSGYGTPKC